MTTNVKVKRKPGRKIVAGSDLQRARAIFALMRGGERRDIIAAFVADKIPKFNANTYYHVIKKSYS